MDYISALHHEGYNIAADDKLPWEAPRLDEMLKQSLVSDRGGSYLEHPGN